jgi:hypothetical protein
MDVVFKKIGFAIQKGLAAQLVAHLPFTHVLLLYINRKCKTHKFFFSIYKKIIFLLFLNIFFLS